MATVLRRQPRQPQLPFCPRLFERLASDLCPHCLATERHDSKGSIEEVNGSAVVGGAKIHVVDATLALPTPLAMWRGMIGNPVAGALIAQYDPIEQNAVERAVQDAFEHRSGGSNRPLLLNASSHVLIARRL